MQNLTPKLWPYAAHYAVLIYNNLPHSALEICPKEPCLLVKNEVLLLIYVDDMLVM